MNFKACFIPLCLILIVDSGISQSPKSSRSVNHLTIPYPIRKIRSFRQGFTSRLWLHNTGEIGNSTYSSLNAPVFEFPVHDSTEHLYRAGITICALKSGVRIAIGSVGAQGAPETVPIDTMIWKSSVDSMNGHNRRFFDDDSDGRVDEDELDGLDNDRDGSIDEDYGAVSESDVAFGYTDTSSAAVGVFGSLGLKVWQKSLAWGKRVREPIIPIEYTIVNIGDEDLRNVYIGWDCDFDIMTPFVTDNYRENYGVSLPKIRTVCVGNAYHPGLTPAGLTILSTPIPMDQLQFALNWVDPWLSGDPAPGCAWMTCLPGCRPFPPPEYPMDVVFMYSFGPFPLLAPGETLKVAVAFISGDDIASSANSIQRNAEKAIILSQRNWIIPPTPPSPPLSIRREGNINILDWEWEPGDSGANPLDTWDRGSSFLGGLPDTNWRRQSPTGEPLPGGKNFGGFKLWRCDLAPGKDTSWYLLKQFTTADFPPTDPNYAPPLAYSWADSFTHPGSTYGYAVTSFSIPDIALLTYPGDSTGINMSTDTLAVGIHESEISANATFINAYFSPSTSADQVKVVPNPYRGDMYYTDGAGYEGEERTWMAQRRQIWFTHLPPRATIRIYSLAGDVIATLEHDDAMRTSGGLPIGQEEWHLFSESGRPIASGIYLFSVESEYGQQVGKFVIIL